MKEFLIVEGVLYKSKGLMRCYGHYTDTGELWVMESIDKDPFNECIPHSSYGKKLLITEKCYASLKAHDKKTAQKKIQGIISNDRSRIVTCFSDACRKLVAPAEPPPSPPAPPIEIIPAPIQTTVVNPPVTIIETRPANIQIPRVQQKIQSVEVIKWHEKLINWIQNLLSKIQAVLKQ